MQGLVPALKELTVYGNGHTTSTTPCVNAAGGERTPGRRGSFCSTSWAVLEWKSAHQAAREPGCAAHTRPQDPDGHRTVRRWHKPGSVLGTMRGRRGQDGERTCVAHTGLRREKPWRSLRRDLIRDVTERENAGRSGRNFQEDTKSLGQR